MATYEATFYLSNFLGSREALVEDENGELELCICIPIERNGLVRSHYSDGIMTYGFVQEMDYPTGGFSHWIRQKTNPSHYSELQSKGMSAPIIGKMKPTNFYHRKPSHVPRVNKVTKID